MYVPADTRIAERCMSEVSDRKKPKLFDTTAARKRAMPQPLQLPLASPTGAPAAAFPPPALPLYSCLPRISLAGPSPPPRVAPKTVTFGPQRGAGGGIIDEVLNVFPCGPESMVFGTSEERRRGLKEDKRGDIYYHAYEFENSFLKGPHHTRLNPLNLMRAVLDSSMLERCTYTRMNSVARILPSPSPIPPSPHRLLTFVRAV